MPVFQECADVIIVLCIITIYREYEKLTAVQHTRAFFFILLSVNLCL